MNILWNEVTISWNEVTISWNEVTIFWNEVTVRWNEMTWNEVTMERSDRNSFKTNFTSISCIKNVSLFTAISKTSQEQE